MVIRFFNIGALCNENIAKILGAIFIFRFWFSRYIAFNYPGNKYFIVSVKCRREMAGCEKGVVVVHDGLWRRAMEYIAAEDSDARVLSPVAVKCAGNNCCDLFFTTLVPKRPGLLCI